MFWPLRSGFNPVELNGRDDRCAFLLSTRSQPLAKTLDPLRQKRDAAETAALVADLDAGNGIPDATLRAETLHREAQFYSTRIARLEADPAELLKALYLERETVCTAGQVAEAPEQVEALTAKLGALDTRINSLENPHGTRH